MKKIILSTAVITTLSMGASDVEHPHERIDQSKQTTVNTDIPAIEENLLTLFF